ncbi:DUF3189 family protein [Bacillus sp. CRN 9]|nr:DUF3189 family protein [Bacillus sp. CRN 9]
MIYIFNDYGGTHTTSLAAALHLNILKPSNHYSKEEILSVPFFNKLTKEDFGKLVFHGRDTDGHPVYTLGRKSNKLVVPALKEFSMVFFNRYQIEERVIFSNTSPTVPLLMSLGGFFSRGLKMDSIGVPLLIKGAQQCINNIHQLVEHTKQSAHFSIDDNILILNNEQYKK